MNRALLTALSGALLVSSALAAFADPAPPGIQADDQSRSSNSQSQAQVQSESKARSKSKAEEAREREAMKPAATKPVADPADKPVKKGTMDRMELDTTAITGNRELPKVLYIVPWKKSDLGDLAGRPAHSLLDEVLAPVDRDVFRRQTEYFSTLNPGSGAAAGADPQTKAPAPPADKSSKN